MRHCFDAVLVFKLDRAFRSVKHMHDPLAVCESLNVGFLSVQEEFDSTAKESRFEYARAWEWRGDFLGFVDCPTAYFLPITWFTAVR